MPNILSSNPGTVAQIIGSSLPMNIIIGNQALPNLYDAWRGFNGFKSIITGIRFQQQSGFQLMHTLNQFIYIYSFGERVCDLSINGLSFMANCTDTIDPTTKFLSAPTGLERVVAFYQANRLSKTGAPISITIGTTLALKAFLLGLTIDMADTGAGISQYTMQLKCPPI